MLNNVSIMGRLVAPALPRGSSDNPCAAFSLAVQRDFKNRSGEREVDFIDCVAWGKLGDFALGLSKGQRVVLVGSLRCGSYTASDNTVRRSVQVVADHIYYADSKQMPEPGSGSAAEPLPSLDTLVITG